MEILSSATLLERLCKATGKWGMFVSFPPIEDINDCPVRELEKVALWFNFDDHGHAQAMVDGYGIILFDSQDEMDKAYEQAVGDDGPTDLNPYNGPLRVYCLTCGPDGQTQNENT